MGVEVRRRREGGAREARPNVTSFSHERAFSRSCEIIGRMRRDDASFPPSHLGYPSFLRYADYSENAFPSRIPMRSFALDSLDTLVISCLC